MKIYLWSDGSSNDSLIVTESGEYWVECTDLFGYVSRDTIIVNYLITLKTRFTV